MRKGWSLGWRRKWMIECSLDQMKCARLSRQSRKNCSFHESLSDSSQSSQVFPTAAISFLCHLSYSPPSLGWSRLVVDVAQLGEKAHCEGCHSRLGIGESRYLCSGDVVEKSLSSPKALALIWEDTQQRSGLCHQRARNCMVLM